ncbi:MAG: hypothetical protein SFW36_18260 [Leptolyngbyaceae cyanobacterium bins.59]|nr:hypothetical protein [Leptolyngbyaceae cyanobacterium bins.59]
MLKFQYEWVAIQIVLFLITAVPGMAAGRQASVCAVVARVLKGGSHLSAGKLICMGEKVQSQAQVLCFVSGRVKEIGAGQVVSQVSGCNAPPRQTQNIRRCGPQEIYLCVRPKGSFDPTLALRLTTPIGRVVATTTPTFAWRPTPSAHHYLIQVEGPGIQWQQQTSSPTLEYPQTRSPLRYGQAYRVTISAYDAQQKLMGARQSVVNVLSQNTIREMQQTLAQLETLAIYEDEKVVLDQTSVYLANGLLDSAISVLQQRVRAGSQDATLHRVLADCYLSAGMPQLAKLYYENAIQLAKRESNLEVLHQAQFGLAEIAAERY